MKTFQRMLAILLVAAASAGLMAACGETSENDCIDDADCDTGQACNLDTSTCGFACTGPEDETCLDDEICDLDATEGDGGVCVIADTNNGNNQPECTADADCDEAAGETCNTDTGMCEGDQPECTTADDCDTAAGEICNSETGMCEVPDVDYQYARISDVSEDTAALCDVSDPGADIFGIELVKASGDSYWAQWENYDNVVTEGNDEASPVGILDGSAPGLTDSCPESFSGNVVALGCGGSLIVSFNNDEGNPEYAQDGDTITVYEYGAQCNNGAENQDTWSISICEASSDVLNAECAGEVVVGSGSGIADKTVDTSAM